MFTLSPLPWKEEALMPHISPETIQYHYGKHHAAYVAKMNELTKGTPMESLSVDDIVMKADGVLFNQAAQVWNHDFYWKSLTPSSYKTPKGELKTMIERDFQSFDKFKELFSTAAAGQFGSGWAWLIVDPTSKLKIYTTSNAGNPIRDKAGLPLFTCDVWEHAYYIDYRNARPKYIQAWWELLNWDFAEKQLTKALH